MGRDTYVIGKINYTTLKEVCKILKGFSQIMSDYNIQSYTAVVTSAIREATNRDYRNVLQLSIDNIRLKYDVDIQHSNVVLVPMDVESQPCSKP